MEQTTLTAPDGMYAKFLVCPHGHHYAQLHDVLAKEPTAPIACPTCTQLELTSLKKQHESLQERFIGTAVSFGNMFDEQKLRSDKIVQRYSRFEKSLASLGYRGVQSLSDMLSSEIGAWTKSQKEHAELKSNQDSTQDDTTVAAVYTVDNKRSFRKQMSAKVSTQQLLRSILNILHP